MTKGVVLRGVVVTESDLPVPGAEIEARWQHGGRVERTTRADGRGHFELAGLPAAPLEILARAADGTSAPKRFDLSTPIPDEDVLLVLDNTGVITGRVTRGGSPVSGAQVFFVEQSPRAKVHPAVVNCDDAGAFRIAGIALDRMYSLTAMPHQDGDAWFRSGGVAAKAGANVMIEIPADGNLRGRVDAGGSRLADIRVELEGNTPARPLDRDGKFAFTAIPPGSRTLLFTGPKIAEQRVTAELRPGEDLDVGVIKLAAGRLVTGKVVDANQRHITDAELFVQAEGSSELRVPAAADGTFSLVAPADRALTIETRSRRGGFTRTMLPATGSSTGLVIKLAGTSTLEGAITVGDDPSKGVLVEMRAEPTSERPYAYTETDSAGYFKLQAIEPGTYELLITRTDPSTLTPIQYAQSIDIKAGANLANIDLKQLKPR
jgi:hypothetical protein